MFFTWNDKLYTITVKKKKPKFSYSTFGSRDWSVASEFPLMRPFMMKLWLQRLVIVHDSIESIQKVYMYIQWHSLCRILLCLELLFACPCHEILVNANAYWYCGILFCTELYCVEKNNQNLFANISLSWFYVYVLWGEKNPMLRI